MAALEMLADALGVRPDAQPQLATLDRPDRPTGAVTAQAVGQAMARHMPEGAIFCDESLTNGQPAWELTHGAPAHDFIQITGGAIGCGMPLATGAAVACPDRKVVALQADGSGAFTLQALWTQARERLDVVTLILSNRRYAILRGELARVGANEAGKNASRMLDLDDPAMDWVSLAKGFGVEAVGVDTAEALDDALAAAMSRPGPFLIELRMP